MAQYRPPLRDMQFVLHELLNVTDELKMIPRHADIDTHTINAVLEEGGKFAAEVLAPINLSGDTEGCKLDKATSAVIAPSWRTSAKSRTRRSRSRTEAALRKSSPRVG